MQGSIRMVIGMLVALGVAGAIDTATDSELAVLAVIGAVGLGIMISGVKALNR
jgi:hypothetical protein